MKEDPTLEAATVEENTATKLLARMREVDLEVLAWYWDTQVKPLGIPDFLRPFEDDQDFQELQSEIYALEGRVSVLPGKRLLAELRDAKLSTLHPIEWQDAIEPVGLLSPHYPTGCSPVDEILSGGAYGVTVVAGAPKVGKSLLAISTCVEAARAGWKVVYINAELSRAQVSLRFANYMGRIDPIVVERIRIANVTTGISMDAVLDELNNDRVEYTDTKVLVIVDSINRVVDMGAQDGSENGYWKILRDWSAWAMNSRRATEGRVSWLIISELASHGGVKGRSLEYLADVVIRINATGTEDIVEVDVPLSRGTRSGYIGALRRDFQTGRFERGQ